MKIVMEKDQLGSPDGIATVLYKAGKEYDVNPKLAGAFIKDLKVAKAVEGEDVLEIKQVEGAPENKELDPVGENKVKKGKK
jgi:hypothetical protein